MRVDDILQAIADAHGTIRIKGDTLLVQGMATPLLGNDELIAAIRKEKPAIIAALQERAKITLTRLAKGFVWLREQEEQKRADREQYELAWDEWFRVLCAYELDCLRGIIT